MNRLDSLRSPVPRRGQNGALPYFENLNSFYGQDSYPPADDPSLNLRIAETYQRIHNLECPPSSNSILLTCGAVDAFELILKALTNPGDRMALLEPAFLAYEHFGKVHRLEIHKLDLGGGEFNEIPFQAVQALRPNVIVLNSPNNPIGSCLSISQIGELASSVGDYVVVDEAYIEFSDSCSAIGLLERYPNILILRTFSKAFGIPGARCGLILASPKLIQLVRKVQVPFSVSRFAHAEIDRVLTEIETVTSSWYQMRLERSFLYENLLKFSLFKKVFASQASFVAAECLDGEKLYDDLLRQGIQISNASNYRKNLLRISVGTRSANRVLLSSLNELDRLGRK